MLPGLQRAFRHHSGRQFPEGDVRTGRQSQEGRRGVTPNWRALRRRGTALATPRRPSIFFAQGSELPSHLHCGQDKVPFRLWSGGALGGRVRTREHTRACRAMSRVPLTLRVPFPFCWLWSLDTAPC